MTPTLKAEPEKRRKARRRLTRAYRKGELPRVLLAASLYPEVACTLLDLGTLRLSNRETACTLYMSPRGFSAI